MIQTAVASKLPPDFSGFPESRLDHGPVRSGPEAKHGGHVELSPACLPDPFTGQPLISVNSGLILPSHVGGRRRRPEQRNSSGGMRAATLKPDSFPLGQPMTLSRGVKVHFGYLIFTEHRAV